MSIYDNVVNNLPPHLKKYVVEQHYERYTPVDQATWRFSLRQLKSFLADNAHESYLEGLEKTGITINEIPYIEEMCAKLQEFGWSAVPVSGFIPPAAFMELQSLGVLPIASDMRSIDHILYTPAPDIVHEAAGHAPILVNDQFANYLKEYAQIAKKAIISNEDLQQYEAIRELSDIKENPDSKIEDIELAESKLNSVNSSIHHISEAALLGRMNWWTAEYGLIGPISDPKIFGAGLLSSVGEARLCLKSQVKKIPLSVDCIKTSYDITEPQPQLFVAGDFSDLTRVLHEMSEQLSYKRGGSYGLETARTAMTVNTVELNSGLQVSGVVSEFTLNQGEPSFFKTNGPTQLCELEHQLDNHGKSYHSHGFSSPIGFLKESTKCLSQFQPDELKAKGIIIGQKTELLFESGIIVQGLVKGLTYSKSNQLMIISFEDCSSKKDDKVLFAPDWGTFDMAVGSQIVSVFAGPADRISYGEAETFAKKLVPQKKYIPQDNQKYDLYRKIKQLRLDSIEGKNCDQEFENILKQIHEHLPTDWLSRLELLELSYRFEYYEDYQQILIDDLQKIKADNDQLKNYIELGLNIANQVM